MAALAIPRAPARGVVRPPLLLVVGLLLLFAVSAGWILLTGRPQPGAAGSGVSMVLLSIVPALTAGAFLVQADRLFGERTRQADTRALTRGLSVSSELGVLSSPETVRRLTGYDAALVRGGEVIASTFGEPAPAVGALPAPPASFTSGGSVRTPAGPSSYLALRVDGQSFLVATVPEPHERLDRLGARLHAIGALLVGWLLLVGAATAIRARRPVSA
jgi:hypothetical protein